MKNKKISLLKCAKQEKEKFSEEKLFRLREISKSHKRNKYRWTKERLDYWSLIFPKTNIYKKFQDVMVRRGITELQIARAFEFQGRKCAICGYSDLGNLRIFPVVDHCHKTGRFRGLLCSKCNQAIGLLRDSSSNAMAAYRYLVGLKHSCA